MKSLKSISAWFLCTLWILVLTDADLAKSPGLAAFEFLSLYILTCAAVLRLKNTEEELHWSASTLVFVTSAVLIFTVWGLAVSQFGAWPVPETVPKELRLSLLFMNGPLAALALAAVLAFPLCNLFNRAFWAPPVLAFFMVFAFEFSLIVDPTSRQLTRWLTVEELLRILLIPLALRVARKHVQSLVTKR